LTRRVDLYAVFLRPLHQQLHGLRCRSADVIRYARPETHFDQPVETIGQTAVDGIALNDRVRKRPRRDPLQQIVRQIPFQGIDFDRLHPLHGKMEIVEYPAPGFFPQGVPDPRKKADFNSADHVLFSLFLSHRFLVLMAPARSFGL
jgi:hypothetical protein